ncbi:MAG: hypothetical protein ACF8OB_10755 [Phycisphaeraceae bacterium JB051]
MTFNKSILLSLCLIFSTMACAQNQLSLGKAYKANPMIAGLNNNFIRGDLKFDDPGFNKIIKATNTTSLRYPGGTSGSLFNWETSQFVADDVINSYGPKGWHRRHGEMKKRIAQHPEHTFGAVNFADMCKRLDVEPFWIPNPVTLTPQSNIRFFEMLKDQDIACNYVEMGNECSGGAFWRPFPTGTEYANAIRPVMQRIKQLYPQAQIAVVANGHNITKPKKAEEESGSANKRGDTWNELLLPDRQYFDAIVLHSYGISPDRLRQYKPEQWEDLTLAFPGQYMKAAAKMSREKLGGVPIWLTEYNAAFHHLMEARVLQHDAAEAYFGKVSDSAMHGLMIASYLISAINDPEMWPVMHYHSMGGPPGFRIVRRINEQWRVGPKTQIFSYISQLLQDADTMYPVTIQQPTQLDFTAISDEPINTLAAAMLENKSQRHWVIINRSSKEQTANLPWDASQKATVRHIMGTLAPEEPDSMWPKADSINTQQFPWSGPIAIPSQTISRDGKKQTLSQTLPPHSMTVVSLTR